MGGGVALNGQMTIGELMDVLKDYHPADRVAIMTTSKRHMVVTGTKMGEGAVILLADWEVSDKPVEDVRDMLLRQRRDIEAALEKVDPEALKKQREKVTNKPKKKRTKEEQLAAGYIPTGMRGRPRKMRDEEDFLKEGYGKVSEDV